MQHRQANNASCSLSPADRRARIIPTISRRESSPWALLCPWPWVKFMLALHGRWLAKRINTSTFWPISECTANLVKCIRGKGCVTSLPQSGAPLTFVNCYYTFPQDLSCVLSPLLMKAWAKGQHEGHMNTDSRLEITFPISPVGSITRFIFYSTV